MRYFFALHIFTVIVRILILFTVTFFFTYGFIDLLFKKHEKGPRRK